MYDGAVIYQNFRHEKYVEMVIRTNDEILRVGFRFYIIYHYSTDVINQQLHRHKIVRTVRVQQGNLVLSTELKT